MISRVSAKCEHTTSWVSFHPAISKRKTITGRKVLVRIIVNLLLSCVISKAFNKVISKLAKFTKNYTKGHFQMAFAKGELSSGRETSPAKIKPAVHIITVIITINTDRGIDGAINRLSETFML